MRRSGLLVFVAMPLLLAGCSKGGGSGSGGSAIDASKAAGVAFAYDYGFRLPDRAITAVQDAHASACERLGPRCRITGMRYTVGDSGRIDAMLSLGVDPSMARVFGKDAIAVVEHNEGTLVRQETTGTDAGGTIAEADGQMGQARKQLTEIENRLELAKPGAQRDDLLRQAETLRAAIVESTTAKTGAQASLAMTPITLNYSSASLSGGVDLRDAFSTAWSSLNTMIWVIIVVIGALLPWAALAVSGVFGFRFLRRRFAGRRPVARVEEA